MTNVSLQPGDRVVELAGVAKTVSIVSGATACGVTTWLSKRSWFFTAPAIVIGIICGIVLGFLVSRLLYKPSGGMTTVVKTGPASLPKTLFAGIVAVTITSLSIALCTAAVFSWPIFAATLTSLLCGIFIGVAFAALASLL